MARKPNPNKISTEPVIEEKVETIVTPEETVEEVDAIKIVKGVVSNCTQLNVRKEPKKGAEVLVVIDAKSKVDVEPDSSVDGWYKISTKNGIEGYCMKEFITLK